MRYASLSLLMLFILPSCNKRPYEAEWERPDSALDPIGMSARKQDARERASQSKFKKGEKVTFRNAKTMVFEQNPETSFAVNGTPYSMDSAVVLEPGNLYLKVEMKSGDRGFVSASDLIDPNEFSSNSFGLLPVGTNVTLLPIKGGDEEMPAFLKVAEGLPGSSLEPGVSVLPTTAVAAKPQDTEKKETSAAPAVVSPSTPESSKPALEPVKPVVGPALAPAKANDSLPSSSSDASSATGK